MAGTTFWTNVNTLIKSRHTTQDAVCRQTDISLNTMRGWVSKDILPRADEAVKIATALGTTVEYLVSGEENPDGGELPRLRTQIKAMKMLARMMLEA